MENNIVLQQHLQPLSKYYNDHNLIEMIINKEGYISLEYRNKPKKIIKDDNINIYVLEDICQTLSNLYHLNFDMHRNPKISCALPEGHRFECVLGNSLKHKVALAIRCKHDFNIRWNDTGLPDKQQDFLKQAVSDGKNMVISGSTNTGKTTFMGLLLEEIDKNCRIISVEDTPEIKLDHFDHGLSIYALREKSDETSMNGMLDWRGIYDSLMRLSPERIIFGEISTQNAFAALQALNSGANGFLCSIHAASAKHVYQKFYYNAAWSGFQMDNLNTMLSDVLDYIIHIKRNNTGKRYIDEIYDTKNNTYVWRNET